MYPISTYFSGTLPLHVPAAVNAEVFIMCTQQLSLQGSVALNVVFGVSSLKLRPARCCDFEMTS